MLDLHILINTIHSPSVMNSSAAASFLPICLPKFNAAAFVNAYVTFLRRSDGTVVTSPSDSSAEGQVAAPEQISEDRSEGASRDEVPGGSSSKALLPPRIEIGLVCVCGLADFEAVRGWCATVSEVSPRYGLFGHSLT